MKSYFTIALISFLVSTSFAQVNNTGTCLISELPEKKPATTSVDASTPNSSIYQNPLSESLTIAWNYFNITLNLSIYDTAGILVFQKRVSNNSKISLRHLNDGVYYYKLADGPFLRKSGKLTIKH